MADAALMPHVSPDVFAAFVVFLQIDSRSTPRVFSAIDEKHFFGIGLQPVVDGFHLFFIEGDAFHPFRESEIEGDMGDRNVGLQARLMSQAMRKLTGTISRTNTVCIFINQLREKIGVMFGPSETTTGGNALKFYASVRVDIRPGNSIKDGDNVFGKHAKIKVVKNKVSPPFKECEFDLYFGKGISREGEVVDLSVDLGIIKKSGAWFSYNDNKVANGREKMRQFLKDNPELSAEIEEKIRAAAKGTPVEEIAGVEE